MQSILEATVKEAKATGQRKLTPAHLYVSNRITFTFHEQLLTFPDIFSLCLCLLANEQFTITKLLISLKILLKR